MLSIPFTTKVEKHMNAIASIFGGWANDNSKAQLIKIWHQWLQDEQCLSNLCVRECNTGNEYYIKAISSLEKNIRESYANYFVDKEKFKKLFFVNRDPRGYALKLNTSDSAEHAIPGIRCDWGHYIIFIDETIND